MKRLVSEDTPLKYLFAWLYKVAKQLNRTDQQTLCFHLDQEKESINQRHSYSKCIHLTMPTWLILVHNGKNIPKKLGKFGWGQECITVSLLQNSQASNINIFYSHMHLVHNGAVFTPLAWSWKSCIYYLCNYFLLFSYGILVLLSVLLFNWKEMFLFSIKIYWLTVSQVSSFPPLSPSTNT